MQALGYTPYQPQLVPVQQAENIWTVEGPEIAYRLAGMALPCPTRMTVIRLADGTLWLHSPVSYTAALDHALAQFGAVSALIAPNSFHYAHIAAWAAHHPMATIYAPAELATKIAVPLSRSFETDSAPAWPVDIDQIWIELGAFKEAVFFHRPSRSLIVTDLMQTFESSRIRNPLMKLVMKMGGATGPNAQPSIEIRRAASNHRAALRSGVEQMIGWAPQRIILSHGVCIETDAVMAIRQAFKWLK